MSNKESNIITDLDDVKKVVAEITATETGIAELQKKYAKAVFDVSSKDGITEARAARAEIRKPRYNIEHLRKAAKDPVLKLGRTLDSIATDLTNRLLAIETPIDDQIKAEEKRVADEKQAKIDAENKRIEDIKTRIANLFDGVQKVTMNATCSSEYVEKCIAAYKKKPIDESYQEFQDEAKQTWDSGLKLLEDHLIAVQQREFDDQKRAEELAELEKLRKEKVERDAADLLAREAAEAEQRRATEAERARVDAQRKQQEAEQKKIDEQRAQLKAEQDRIDAEKAEATRKAEADRIAAEKAEAKAQEAARKAQYPGDEAILIALTNYFGVSRTVAEKWLNQLRRQA